MKSLARSAAGAFIAGSLCYGSGSSADVLPFDENVPPGIAISGADAIVGNPGRPSTRPSGPVRGEYIIVFEDTVTDARGLANAIARRNGLTLDHVYENAIKGFSARMPEALVQMLMSDPSVVSVEQNQYVQAFDIVPGVERIGAANNSTAWLDGNDLYGCSDSLSECVDVDVAVIDGGIDPNHSDLNVHQYVSCIGQSIIPQGCGAPNINENDVDHGTHVAGTIGAIDNGVNHDGFEVVGVAPGARIWAVKVLQNGSGTLADINAGIDYVTAHSDEIEVANMSLGFSGCASPSMQAAIANSVAAGVVYVVAAGNSMSDVYGANGQYDTPSNNPFRCRGDDYQPAAYPEAMAVSAMYAFDGQAGGNVVEPSWTYSSGGQTLCQEIDGDDTMACFSNFSANVTNNNPVTSPGKAIDISGPGVDVLSTVKEGYGRKHGTSMASPHVAGAVALYIAQNGLTPSSADDVYGIRQDLINSAQAQTSWGPDVTFDTQDPDGNEEGLVNVADPAPAEPTPPTASFTDDCTGLTCNFADTSSDDGTIVSRSWDFGDFSPTSTDQNPTHTYAANGSYTVQLTVTDNDGLSDTASKQVTVDDTPIAPTAMFSFSCTDLTCDFTDTSSDDGTIVSWLWDFGDGSPTSTAQNPSHTYAAGTYTVSLTVTDDDDLSDTTSQDATASDPATGGITLSVRPYKVRGRQKVDLDWTGATTQNVRIHRDNLTFDEPNTGAWTDNIDQRGGGSYQYWVCELDGGVEGTCSDPETASF